jgi:5'(3')-deoxyribonucleotidase
MGEFEIREEKPKIAIDVDGTLAKTMEALLEKFNKENNTNFTLNDLDDWEKGIEKVFGSYEKFFEMYNELWEKEREKIEPHVTKNQLEELSKYYDIVVVSNRQDEKHKEFIKDWLKKKFDLELKVVLVKDVWDKISNDDYKLVIDDVPNLAESIAMGIYKNKKLILVERPWNEKTVEKIKNLRSENVGNVSFVETTGDAIRFAIMLRREEIKNERLIIAPINSEDKNLFNKYEKVL